MDENLLTFQITSVKQETGTAKSYFLEPVSQKPLIYIPGQFLTFIIMLRDQEVRRSYSITSLPGEPLMVTVQKVDNGLISRHILASWKAGDRLVSLPPMGRFTLPPQQEMPRDIFCFAAGSGIVPVLPQLRRLLVEEPQSIIHLVYSNRNERSTLFLSEIESVSKEYPQLQVTLLFSNPEFRLSERGRLSNLYTQDLVKRSLSCKKEDAVFLICGPFTYMRMLGITLISMHFRKENIRRENFLPEIMRSGFVSHPDFPDRSVIIQILGHRHLLPVKSGQDILTAALENGLSLPYSCRGGVCGTCAAICSQGRVYMSLNEVLTENDLSGGWVLTCTGYPAEDETTISF
jgi:ring-1,2-phenylacetyl-CoA epoxidase subunit PaaE